MTSFRNFLEIAINSDMDPPKVFSSPRTNTSKIVHGEDDPSHGLIPFEVAPRLVPEMIESISKLDLDQQRKGYPRATVVLERLLNQFEKTNDGGPLLVNISNLEADELVRLSNELTRHSKEVLSSKINYESMKDEAMRWIAFGNNLRNIVKRGMANATMR